MPRGRGTRECAVALLNAAPYTRNQRDIAMNEKLGLLKMTFDSEVVDDAGSENIFFLFSAQI